MLSNGKASWVRRLASFFFPTRCVGCQEQGPALCEWCICQVIDPGVQTNHYASACGVSWVVAAAGYQGVARACVLSAKHDSAAFPQTWTMIVGEFLAQQVWEKLAKSSVLYIVPAPSGVARRWLGRYVAAEIAHSLGQALVRIAEDLGEHLRTEVVCALSMPPWIRGQAGLDGRQRLSRMGSVYARSSSLPPFSQVILVDDVIASGGTIRACVSALRDLKVETIGVAVVCASQRRGRADPSSISEIPPQI